MKASNGMPPKLQVLQVAWVAMCVAVVIYGVVAFLVAGANAAPERSDPFANPLVIALHLAGFASIVAGLVVVPMILRARRDREPNVPPQPGAPFVLTQQLMQAMIVRFALFESAAIMGLVLAFVTGVWILAVPLGLAALSALMLSFPSEEKLRALESGSTATF